MLALVQSDDSPRLKEIEKQQYRKGDRKCRHDQSGSLCVNRMSESVREKIDSPREKEKSQEADEAAKGAAKPRAHDQRLRRTHLRKAVQNCAAHDSLLGVPASEHRLRKTKKIEVLEDGRRI